MYSEKLIVVQRAAFHELTAPFLVQIPHAAQRPKCARAQRTFARTTWFTDWLGF